MNGMEFLSAIGDLAPPPREILVRAAEVLEAAIEDERLASQRKGVQGKALHLGARSFQHFKMRRATAIAAAVLVLGSTALGVIQPWAQPTSADAAVLRYLANVAAEQLPGSLPGSGQYLHSRSIEEALGTGPGGYRYLQRDEHQSWIASDGSGRSIDILGEPTFLTQMDQTEWVAAGKPKIATGITDLRFGAGGLSLGPANGSALPTNLGTLYELINSRQIEGGPPGPAEDFIQIADLEREGDLSPRVRAALFRVAASLPGIASLGTTQDHAGRAGTGLAVQRSGVRYEMVFSLSTSQLLGEQESVVNGSNPYDVPVGTVVGWSVYLGTRLVDSLPPTSSATRDAPAMVSPVAPGAELVPVCCAQMPQRLTK